MKTAIAVALLAALAACSSPVAPQHRFQPQATTVHRDTYCTDDPPPNAVILGECPYGSGFLVSAG